MSVHGLCRALAARGHDVHVYTTSVDGAADSDVPHGEPVEIDGVKVWYYQSRYARRIYWSPRLAAALDRHVREFAIVHTQAIFLWPLWAAARAARRAGVPYVVSPRGMLEKRLVRQKSAWLKSAWLTLVERTNLERASAIHVTSAREAAEARAFGFDLPACVEVPNGVALAATPVPPFSPAMAALVGDRPFVLCLGRLSWKKGLDRMLAALALTAEARVVIAGGDDEGYRTVLDRIIADLGIQSRVTFVGPVDGDDKAALLGNARALVLPSYSENFGNVVLEAMAAGCPVVVTPEVGVADMVAASGVGLVTTGEPAAIAAGISALLADPALARRLGALGRAVAASQFSWDTAAERMECCYREILRMSGPADANLEPGART